jgi:hypothetical protein
MTANNLNNVLTKCAYDCGRVDVVRVCGVDHGIEYDPVVVVGQLVRVSGTGFTK